jgi:hypothetical protein
MVQAAPASDICRVKLGKGAFQWDTKAALSAAWKGTLAASGLRDIIARGNFASVWSKSAGAVAAQQQGGGT